MNVLIYKLWDRIAFLTNYKTYASIIFINIKNGIINSRKKLIICLGTILNILKIVMISIILKILMIMTILKILKNLDYYIHFKNFEKF